MKIAYLSDASQETVSEVVRDLLKERGALVTERTGARIRFVGLNPGSEFSFTKGGYVGVYQHVGEREAEVRVQVEATIPARIFWRTVAIEFLAGVLLFVINPDAAVYAVAAFAMWAAFVVALLLYLGTWRSSRALERALVDDLVDRLAGRADAPKEILLEEDRLLKEFEETLEAEIVRLELKARRREAPPTPGASGAPVALDLPDGEAPTAPARPKVPLASRLSGFVPRRKPGASKRDSAGAPVEDADAKRARLLALKEELARRKAQAPPGETPEAKRARLQALREELERRKRGQS